MSFERLAPAEKECVRQSMLAILSEGLIDDFEFQTRLGVDKARLAAVVDSYPNIDDRKDDSSEALSINNCLNELCFGVRAGEDVWVRIGVDREGLRNLYRKWARLRGWKSTGIL